MEEIADEAIVEKLGIAIRLVKDSGTYIVKQAPIDQERKYNENEFRVFGGPVGYVSSEFDNEEDAKKFFNDIQILSEKQLAKRYPKIWAL